MIDDAMVHDTKWASKIFKSRNNDLFQNTLNLHDTFDSWSDAFSDEEETVYSGINQREMFDTSTEMSSKDKNKPKSLKAINADPASLTAELCELMRRSKRSDIRQTKDVSCQTDIIIPASVSLLHVFGSS